MPLEIFETGDKRAWALWRITETEQELAGYLASPEGIPENITNQSKRVEWLAGRLITQTLLENFGYDFAGMRKNEFGKPFLNDIDFNVSLSHSFPFVGVIIDKETVVGIDLEQPKEKLLRVAPRVLAMSEVVDAGVDIVKHCIYWCSKETLIKIHGKKDLTLSKNLLIDPFEKKEEGNLIGRIIVGESERLIPLYYRLFPNFVVVFNS